MKNKFFALSFLVFSLLGFSQESKEKTNQKFLRINSEISPEKALQDFSKEFKLSKGVNFQKITSNTDRMGYVHDKYQQFFKGLKVEFGIAIVHSKDGKAKLVNGELYAIENQTIQPILNSEQGLTKAMQHINAQSYLWENEVQSKLMEYKKPLGDLVLLPNLETGIAKLAYKYDVYATQPISRNEIYVDANSGDILLVNAIIKHAHELFSDKDLKLKKEEVERAVLATGNADTRYSGTRQIETTFNGSEYILQDFSRGDGILTYNCEDTGNYQNVDFTDNDNNWTSAEHANLFKDDGALDAHWGAETTYDFWGNVFGRNSYDNNGAAIRSYVHHGNYNNASWNGSVMTYGDGSSMDILTSIDVCGHEIGHAVCTHTANLVYQNESGAMNEGFSDIWGACIEHYGRTGGLTAPRPASVWLIGEDLAASALRSMSNPNSKGDPDTYGGTYYYTGTADNGGVHTNSGVLNHWFYILSEGEAGTNNAPSPDTYNVTGIGLDKAAEIAYLAERDYLTPNATFLDARNATIEVAYILYCANSPEAQSVTNSWYAVNVGELYSPVNFDIALQSITQNTIIPCETNSFATTITFKNQGLNTLTSVNISYNVDGGTNTNEVWSGSLGLCQEQTYPISVTGLARGAHTLNITTMVTSDGRPENNTKSIVFFINDAGVVNVANPFTNATDALISYNDEGIIKWNRNTRAFPASMTTSGNTVYLMNNTGNYPDATKSYLVSQCYDLTTLSNPQISFDMKYDLEQNWDVVYVEYSTDFGANWSVLGAMGANWYNSNRTLASSGGNDCYNCPGAQWTGTNTTNTNYFYSLSALNTETNIIFRIVFHSDEAVTQLGVNVDNFLISGTLSADNFNSNDILVYPNPSKGVYNISVGSIQLENVEVYDINGRLILIQNSFDNNFETKINLTDASTGIYFIKISAEGKNIVKRIVKE